MCMDHNFGSDHRLCHRSRWRRRLRLGGDAVGTLASEGEFRPSRWHTLLGVLVLVFAACGGGSKPAQPPTVGLGLPSTSAPGSADVNQKMEACLESKGFSVTVGPDGGMDIRSPDPKATPRAGIESCQEELQEQGVLPDSNAPPSRADLEGRYKVLLGVNSCMKQHNYPTVEPPSLDVFIEGGGLWHPYDATFGGPPNADGLSSRPSVDLAVLQRDCPEL